MLTLFPFSERFGDYRESVKHSLYQLSSNYKTGLMVNLFMNRRRMLWSHEGSDIIQFTFAKTQRIHYRRKKLEAEEPVSRRLQSRERKCWGSVRLAYIGMQRSGGIEKTFWSSCSQFLWWKGRGELKKRYLDIIGLLVVPCPKIWNRGGSTV